MHKTRLGLAAAVLTACVCTTVALTGTAGAVPAPTPPTTSDPGSAPASGNVIVLLKDQHPTVRATRGQTTNARTSVLSGDQASLVADARAHGATGISQFTTVNGFAASLSQAESTRLAANPAVAAIVPNAQITQAPAMTSDAGKVTPATKNTALPGVCPTKASKPFYEPEALQAMNVINIDGGKAGTASSITDGSGVKVAFLADGLDINNPDFQRNGQSVFSDYQDFSGDGTDAVTSGAEAFGDASAIAAQANQTYDLSQFVSPANPLPANCNIKIRGVAPGATLVGLKVFGNSDSAPTSNFIDALDYAVNTAGVDVINESFGANPFPDNGNDPITLANNAAVNAGVTVVASTGDSGTTNTIGSPASSYGTIGVAATTQFRSYAQTSIAGINNPAAKITGWASGNISNLSSGGFAQNGKVPDISAPGDLGWALCSTDTQEYVGCTNPYGGSLDSIQNFGGTSQSSPLTSGTAALVIAAYRAGHNGSSPTPMVVKQILTNTASDLGHPSSYQGAGQVNAYRAVLAARDYVVQGKVPANSKTDAIVTNVSQLDVSGLPGNTITQAVTVTNESATTQTVTPGMRALTSTLSDVTNRFTFDGSTLPTFPNVTGSGRAYVLRTVPVGAGADRLTVKLSDSPVGYTVFAALISPTGVYSAYSLPQGLSFHANLDVVDPAPGNWKLQIWANPAFTGQIVYESIVQKFAPFGSVSGPLTLAPGASGTVTTQIPTASQPGDLAASLQLVTSPTVVTSVPVSVRTVIPTSATVDTFGGTLSGGNGRSGVGESQTFYFDVAAGKPAISLGIRLTGQITPDEQLTGTLIDPNGQPVSSASNLRRSEEGDTVTVSGLEVHANTPIAGRWIFTLTLGGTVAGNRAVQPFTGAVSFGAHSVSAAGLPTSASTVLAKGTPVTVPVTVTNDGSVPLTYFADARLSTTKTYPLASQVPGNNLQNVALPQVVTPSWLVPTDSTAAVFTATGSVPVNLDIYAANGASPEYYGQRGANNTSQLYVCCLNSNIAQGSYAADIGEVGPFSGPEPAATVALSAAVTTRTFDPAVKADTADFWKYATVAGGSVNQPGFDPITLNPGDSGVIHLTITPTAAKGATVTGTVFIDTYDGGFNSGDEIAGLNYTYKVG